MKNKTTDRPKTENLSVVSLKLDAAVLTRADELIPHTRSTTGARENRSTVLRAAIMRGLRAMEDELQDDERSAGEGVVSTDA